LGEPKEPQFYYRSEVNGNRFVPDLYVIYIPTDIAISEIRKRLGTRAERWENVLPLSRNSDIYGPFIGLGGRSEWMMRLAIANVIESGKIAIGIYDSNLESIVVERWNEGCESGRIFKTIDGKVLFEVLDSIS
jgi:hypothetical protein